MMDTPDAAFRTLPDDALVMLDPAVEILDTEVDEFTLLCQTDLETGIAVPPGEGSARLRKIAGGQARPHRRVARRI